MQGTDLDIWISFFVLSKIAEFFDTVLKILLQKKFLFLHWSAHLPVPGLSLRCDVRPACWPNCCVCVCCVCVACACVYARELGELTQQRGVMPAGIITR